MISQCRHIPGTWDQVAEAAHGTRGTSQISSYRINNKTVHDRNEVNPYVQEHTDLIAAIRDGKEINELKHVAESTMTAILGREAGYSGKETRWDTALDMRRLCPVETVDLTWDTEMPVPPVPVPGKYNLKEWPLKKKANG